MDLTKIALGAGAGFVIAKILDENLSNKSGEPDNDGSEQEQDYVGLSPEEFEQKAREDHEQFFDGQKDWKSLKELAILVELDDIDNLSQEELIGGYEKLKEAVLIIHSDGSQDNLSAVYFLDNLSDDIESYTDPNEPSENAQQLFENISVIQDEISSGSTSDEIQQFIETEIILPISE